METATLDESAVIEGANAGASGASPMPRVDKWAHRRGEPRLFVVLWAVYLLGASAAAMGGVGIFGLAGTDIYRPAARVMLCLAGLGLGVLWPMVRLSQARPLSPIAAFLLDAFIVVFPAIAVVISQGMPSMAAWPLGVASVIAASFGAWGVFIAGALSLYFRRIELGEGAEARLPRWLWMLLIVMVVCIGPLAALFALALDTGPEWVGSLLMTSPVCAPFAATWEYSRQDGGAGGELDVAHLLGALAPLPLGVIAWALTIHKGEKLSRS